MADRPRCETCRYSRAAQQVAEDALAGEGGSELRPLRCCRYPPVRIIEGNPTVIGYFPGVTSAQWCGEYAPANPETAEEAVLTLIRFVLTGDMTAARALADKLRE